MSYLLYLHSQRFSRWMDSGLGYCGDSTNAKNADKSENRRVFQLGGTFQSELRDLFGKKINGFLSGVAAMRAAKNYLIL